MERVLLKHLSGSKVNQVEEFPLSDFRELTFGRDPAVNVRYDPERDDLVGRQHARLVRDPGDPYRFSIIDLNSRNGTYVNKQRIVGTAVLSPGDIVQFGPGGPQFEFTIDPLPAHLVKATRIAGAAVPAPPATRVAETAAPPAPAAAASGTVAPRQDVGRATVERIVADARTQSRRTTMAVAAVVLLLVAAAGGFLVYRSMTSEEALVQKIDQTQKQVADVQKVAAVSAADIARDYTESTVFLEVGWKLILTETGGQVYHEYYVETDGRGRPVKKDGQQVPPIPVYIMLPDGKVEPSLSLERGDFGQNQPIGGQHTGSGFVVTSDGFILTNRHVAATWETSYMGFPDGGGLLVHLDSKKVERLGQAPRDWVPTNARILGRRSLTGKNVEGRLDYLDVTFAKTKLRAPAKLARVSDRHDAAMIKVDVPQPVKKVPLLDNYDAVRPGMPITILGYPAVSPTVSVVTRSQDPFNREAQERTVPDPTVTGGLIGRVLRGEMSPTGGRENDYWSNFGDSYQLTANATGGGNSGGPVFDDSGHVIAIYYASRQLDARITFAVPIRYGVELMQVGSVIR